MKAEVAKISNVQIFKNWFNLARPSTKYFMISLITACIHAGMAVLEPVAAANVITSLTVQDYTSAILWLVGGFGILAFRSLIWHLNYWNYTRLLGHVYTNINRKIYRKVMNASDENFKTTSSEKILNIIVTDVTNVGDFADIIANRIASMLRIIIVLVIVALSSPIAAGLILAVSVANFFIINWLGKRLAKSNKTLREKTDETFETFSDANEGRQFIKDYGLSKATEEEYIDKCNTQTKARHKNTMDASYIDNIFYIFWNACVMAITLVLIWTLSTEAVSLTIYLVIVGYLTPTIERVNHFYGLFKDLRVINVAVGRINTILNFTDKELIEYGTNMKQKLDGSISFLDVSVKPSPSHTETLNEIKNISFAIEKGEIALFYGPQACGKRSIFHLMRRAVKADSGMVALSGINILDYSEAVHASNVTYTTHKPYFFEGSVMDNFNKIEKSKRKIEQACKRVGIHAFLTNLPEGYNTNIQKHKELFDERIKYLMGLVRALLTRAEVIMIYEFPLQFSQEDQTYVEQAILSLAGEKTVLIFSANLKCAPICNRIFRISRGVLLEEGGEETEG